MRVYLPATLAELPELIGAGSGTTRPGHAVTASLRNAVPDEDDAEVLEFYALMLAADESAATVRRAPLTPQRRLVLAVDAPDDSVAEDPDRGPGAVLVVDSLTWDRVAALHVDEAAAEPIVAAGGDTDDCDLLWYAPAEATALVVEAGLTGG